MSKLKNIINKKFGRMKILARLNRDKNGNLKVLCLCDCGIQKIVSYCHLITGDTKSCGCLNNDNIEKRTHHPINFFNKNNKSTYYWAGFLFGDGCINKYGKLVICLSSNNGGYKHLQKLSNFIYGKDYVNRYKNTCNLQSSNLKLIKNLNKFGIIYNKTYEGILKIPNKKHVKDFIRGYFDADGWASIAKNKYKGRYRYKSLNIGICSYLEKNLKIISKYLPVKSYINKKKRQELYELRIFAKKDTIKFMKFLQSKNKRNYLECKWNKIWNFVNS